MFDDYIEDVAEIGSALGYELRIVPSATEKLHLIFQRPEINVHVESLEDDKLFTYLWVRTSSWQLQGERTDANEIISMLLACFLRLGPLQLSSHLWDVEHPAIIAPETELYARYITFEQPITLSLSLSASGISSIKQLLQEVSRFEALFTTFVECNYPPHIFEAEGKQETRSASEEWPPECSYEGYPAVWAGEIARLIGEPLSDSIQFVERKCPAWLHYRSIATQLTVYHVPGLTNAFFNLASADDLWQILPGVKSTLYISSDTGNCIPLKQSSRVSRILIELDQLQQSPVKFIPLENHLVGAAGEYLIFAECDCGKKQFEREREKIRARHLKESEFLFPVAMFTWNAQIDDDDFELMVLELLNREKGVIRTRKVSSSNERDGGRDLLCDWDTLPLPGQAPKENQPLLSTKRILVQCKAYQASVGKSKVQDIRDTVEEHSAQGYFLAVSSYLASGLTTHLQKMRDEGKLWVDWWTRNEIEDRLKNNLDVAAKYKHIVIVSREATP